MKERFIIEMVYDKISKCKSCCSKCPCKKLAEYISNIGIDEFYQRYISNNLPEEILLTFEKKIEVMNL